MRSAGLAVAVKVGWNRRRQWRWMLSRHGVLQASELFFHGAIPNIATEEALKSRLAVLPILEIFHEIAPTVRRDWLAHSRKMAEENPNLEVSHLMTENFLTRGGLDLSALQWNQNGYPQAVGTYDQGRQTPFVFVDRQADARTLVNLAQARFLGLSTPDDDPTGQAIKPGHWVIVCHGAVSTELARRHLWPDESRIMVQMIGSDIRVDYPRDPDPTSGSLVVPPTGPATLGKPENIYDWVKTEPAMLIYRDGLGVVCSPWQRIIQWHGPRMPPTCRNSPVGRSNAPRGIGTTRSGPP